MNFQFKFWFKCPNDDGSYTTSGNDKLEAHQRGVLQCISPYQIKLNPTWNQHDWKMYVMKEIYPNTDYFTCRCGTKLKSVDEAQINKSTRNKIINYLETLQYHE